MATLHRALALGAAALLSAIAGSDPADPATKEADAKKGDYLKALDRNALKGARIGVWHGFRGRSAPTDAVFDQAVDDVIAYALQTGGYRVIHQLNASKHPDSHPHATIKLLDSFVAREQLVFFEDDLAQIIERVGATGAEIRDDNRYRGWASHVVQRQF